MLEWPLSFPYPASKVGYWGPVTSTLNWCEEDYYATVYSAEIVNTVTNLLFMWLGVKGIRSCLRHEHDQIFLVAYCGYLVVGTGSFLFHSTLKYPMQLVDELSMIYTTCLMCYASFSYSRSVRTRVILAISLTSLAVFITLYYHYLQDPVFHQNAYALLTTVVVLRSMWTMEKTLRPSLRHTTEEDRLAREKQGLPVPSKEYQHYENVRDMKTLKTMWFMVGYGLAMFLGGFAIWNLDNFFCSTARRWRRNVGLPWGIFLEGHGWWHIMTGLGAYLYIIWGIWLRHCLNGRQEEYHLRWPHFWNVPEVVRTTPELAHANGASKKSN
ncbi:alkaline phytoceramidase [Aspergillus taichungensis]|uniref:Alkaline phytoceramidase n=1 Tax=Aspergillus taichungensis TaxID=482145 RepID=A0A2J5I651_9EURO|nr:alkaline phytoceramidase [Aspergillus taichungensis]